MDILRKSLVALLLLFSVAGYSQALREINYNYLYNPNQPLAFSMKTVRGANGWSTYYTLVPKDTARRFTVSWELRNALSDKEGTTIPSAQIEEQHTVERISGKVNTGSSTAVQILAAKVIDMLARQAWYYYVLLEPNYPQNIFLTEGDRVITQSYVSIRQQLTVHGDYSPVVVSLYRSPFPAGAPAFSEGQARVPLTIRHDSVFTVDTGTPVTFSVPGLYLIQHDTSSAEGLAFKALDDYPRFTKIESLADPLIYICTKQEFDKIKLAKGDKKAFDRVILNITGDTERARNLMRSYFRRVELANQYFTSYKEGWKTDRGMIYIIFGLPDKVFRFGDREVWSYDNTIMKNTFNFAKSGSLFDPDNFVLLREKKYQDSWYEVIDLWRNARF